MSIGVAQQAMEEAAAGRTGRAKDLLRAALRRTPGDPYLLVAMARVHGQGGEAAAAVEFLRQAASAAPGDAGLRHELASAAEAAGRGELALATYEGMVRDFPHELAGVDGLARTHLSRGDLASAWGVMERAVAAQPDRHEPVWLWVQTAHRIGETDVAVAAAKRGLERFPANRDLLEALAGAMNFADGVDPREHLDLHRRLGAAAGHAGAPAPARDRGKTPLRVALVSGDLCFHACAFFLAGLVTHLDRREFELLLYVCNPADETTANFAAMAPARDVSGLGDDALAAQARADGIDVGVDCGGWTRSSRVTAFAGRLAPLQVTYLGYPNTTGLGAMDVRLVDAVTDPPGSERWCTERLERLDGCFVCYGVAGQTPPPALSAGLLRASRGEAPGGSQGITFGSFNRLPKIQGRALALWAEILRRVPGSSLVLKTEVLPGAMESFRRRFVAAGGDASRVRWLPFEPDPARHLAAYREVDIALDPFPYNGTTTTCEAMAMGVPVVALAGDQHRSRVGASLLTAVGMEELIAVDERGYVATAAGLAADVPRLLALHGTLRGRLLGSRLCDAKSHAEAFARAVRRAWEHVG